MVYPLLYWVVVSKIFIFTPKIREDSHFDEHIFPPTSFIFWVDFGELCSAMKNPGKLTAGFSQKWRWLEDYFPNFNWVIYFCFWSSAS